MGISQQWISQAACEEAGCCDMGIGAVTQYTTNVPIK